MDFRNYREYEGIDDALKIHGIMQFGIILLIREYADEKWIDLKSFDIFRDIYSCIAFNKVNIPKPFNELDPYVKFICSKKFDTEDNTIIKSRLNSLLEEKLFYGFHKVILYISFTDEYDDEEEYEENSENEEYIVSSNYDLTREFSINNTSILIKNFLTVSQLLGIIKRLAISAEHHIKMDTMHLDHYPYIHEIKDDSVEIWI